MDGVAIKGPVEASGRRGLALPLLQRKLAPIGGTDSWRHLGLVALFGFPVERDAAKRLVIHLFVGSIAVRVIVTPLFNASRGSVLLPALFNFQLINPVWPDAQPYDTLVF